MAKQLNLDLNIRANTAQAKSEFQSLQKSLSDIAAQSAQIGHVSVDSTQLKQASAAAQELQRHLSNAVNVDTGKLNLNKLNTSLKQSKTDIGELSGKLLSVGPAGQQAFVQLAQSVANAERPVISLGSRLGGLLTTLKNTARWQISSTILHGFMGALQSAYGYAQDLNKSLNNIRVVTGHSAEQMEKFAIEANNAAKALSTSTTAYTDAALIYYQQGLSDDKVKERTATTIKLANVSRQSAEEVSSQMTAIWNNFDDGSKKLEYYADVITALGANTASSSQEIAEGLSKFAAVADTVGLSYEKASAALATVVAETRQSADIVGTAFKTMFARIEGLTQGETMEDGVGLNKYSEALAKVGVSVLDSTNQLRKMDDILDELGAKWNNIDKTQQVALAQTVAGVRQYTQFVSLMNNYEKVQANEEIAKDSEGTVQKQADIYAESWEASSKRVKASLQGIYDDLLDDKFFIQMNNFFADLLNGLDNFIKGIGGLKGVLLGLGSLLLNYVADKIMPAMQNLKIQLQTMFQSPTKQAETYGKMMKSIFDQAKNQLGVGPESQMTDSLKAQLSYTEKLSIAKNKLTAIDKQLTDTERQQAQAQLNIINIHQQEVQAIADKITKEKEEIDTLMDSFSGETAIVELQELRKEKLYKLQEAEKQALINLRERNGSLKENQEAYNKASAELNEYTNEYTEKTNELENAQALLAQSLLYVYEQHLKSQYGMELSGKAEIKLGEILDSLTNEIMTSVEALKEMDKNLSQKEQSQKIESVRAQVKKLSSDLTQLGLGDLHKVNDALAKCFSVEVSKGPEAMIQAVEELNQVLNETIINGKTARELLVEKMNSKSVVEEAEQKYRNLNKTQQQLTKEQQRLNSAFDSFNPSHVMTGAEAFSKVAAAGMQAAMIINSINSLIRAWTDEDMDPMEKFTTTLMSVGMIVPGVIKSFQGVSTTLGSIREAFIGYNAAQYASELATVSLTNEQSALAAVNALNTTATEESTAAESKNALVDEILIGLGKKNIDSKTKELLATNLLNAAKLTNGKLSEQDIANIIALTIGRKAEIVATEGATVSQWNLNAAMMANPAGLVVAAVLALIATFALLTIAIYNVINAETEEEKAVKKANQELEKAKDVAEEAKKAYEDLKNKISDYKGAVDALKKYTKGTQEWRDAFQDVLNKVNEIIEKYPSLLSYSNLFNSDGTFNEKVLEQGVADYENYSRGTTLIALEAQEKLDREKLKAETQKAYDSTWAYYTNITPVNEEYYSDPNKNHAYAIESTDMQNLVDYMSRSPENKKLINLIEDQSSKLENGEVNSELSQFVKQYFIEAGKSKGLSDKELNATVKNVSLALGALGENFKTLSDETEKTSTSLANNRKLMVANFFGDSVNVGNAANLAAAEVIYEQERAKQEQPLRQDIGQKVAGAADSGARRLGFEGFLLPLMIADVWSNNFQLGIDNGDMQDFAKQYQEANPMAKGWNYKTTRVDNNGQVSFIFEDPQDKNAEHVVSSTDLTNTLAQSKMQESNASGDLQDKVTELTKEYAEKNAVALDYIANRNIQNATLKDIKNFTDTTKIGDEQLQQLMIASGNYKEKDFEENPNLITEERQRIEEAGKAAQATAEALPDYIEDFLPEDIKYADQEKVSQLYKKALVNDSAEVLNGIKTAAGNEAADVLTALSDLDLDNSNVEEANQALAQMGIQFKLSAEQFYSLRNAVRDISSISVETAQETYKQISAILAKIKSQGDILEDEDYNKLLAINPTLESFFTTLADGTHMFTGEIQDFKKAVQSSQMNQMREAIDNQERIVGSYNTIANGSEHDQKDITQAKINILFNNQKTKNDAIDYMADLEAGEETLSSISSKVEESYKSLSLTEEQFAAQTEQAAKKVIELREAMKESLYQNEIANAGLEYETTENYANTLMDLYEAQGLTKDAARELAIANQRLDRGLSSLNDSFEDWTKSLQNTSKASAEYAKTMKEIRTAFADLLNIADSNELSLDWIEKWINDSAEMEKILNGDTEAIQRFRESAFAEMTTNVFSDMQDAVKQLKKEMENSNTKIPNWLTDINNKLLDGKFNAENFRNAINDIDGQAIGAGASLSKEYTDALNQMLAQGLITEQQLNDIFATIGYKPKVTTANVKQWVSVPQYETTEDITETVTENKDDSKSYHRIITSTTKQLEPKMVEQTVPVTQIETEEDGTGKIDIVNAGSVNMSPSYNSTSSGKSSSSGNDSSSSKNTSAASHNHEVNRYSNEENALNGLQKAYDRLNNTKDKAFGASRIQAMDKELKKLKELKNASGDYLDAIVGKGNSEKVVKAIQNGENIGSLISSGKLNGTIAKDYSSLYGGLSASGKNVEYSAKDSNGNEWLASSAYSLADFNSLFGTNISFNLDSYGNIYNKDALLNLIQNLTNQENDAYHAIADPTAGSTTEYNKRIAYLEEIKERIDQYGETTKLMSDKVDEHLDYITQLQEKNAEIITEKMNTGVNLSNITIQKLERTIKVLGNNIYKTAEAMEAWFNTNFSENINAIKASGDAYAEALADTEDRWRMFVAPGGEFNEDAISSEAANEILSSIEDGYDGLIDSALAQMDKYKEYFGNLLNYWNTKYEDLTSTIDYSAKSLEHFQKVLELLGHSADYQALGQIFKGQLDTAESDYNIKKAAADSAQQVYEAFLAEYEKKRAEGESEEALEAYYDSRVKVAKDDFMEKISAMQTALETVLEKVNLWYENEINRIFKESEARLTGKWGSFDALDNAMKNQQSIADEYLTKTNQLYETNTMLRQLSQDIDKTDSKIAKDKLKSFSIEIEALKERERLTKADLDIAKARYELLKAQLALEEIQNAKTTVRLSRDNNGNYGYVYTADENKISDAEQTLADKENALYNIGLKNAENYSQKLISIRKEYESALQDLNNKKREELISHEEYQIQLADLNKTYRDLELTYQENFIAANQVLNEVGAEGQTEAWTSSFDDIINNHKLFNDDMSGESDILTEALNEKMELLNSYREKYTQEAKVGNEDLQSSVKDVIQVVKKLENEATRHGGLIDSTNKALNESRTLTNEFFNQYKALQDLVRTYQTAADKVNNLRQQVATLTVAQREYNTTVSNAPSTNYRNVGGGGAYVPNPGSGSGGNGNSGGTLTVKDISKTGNEEDSTSKNSSKSNCTHTHKGKEYFWRYDPTHHNNQGVLTPWLLLENTKCLNCDKVFKTTTIGWYMAKDASTKNASLTSSGLLTKDPKGWMFKSGGYTGKWASGKTGLYTGSWNGPDIEENGKLAFLHQKELVLNAQDTENMLSAVKLIREISQMIDLQAAAQSSTSFMKAARISDEREPLQQDITIHAEFPNATDHNEIEEAFNSLINKATQFANR